MFTGDLANLPMPGTQTATPEQPWISLSAKSSHDAMYVDKPASQRLTQYTRDWPRQRAPMAMEAMLRDHMPPLENLVVGGHPGPIGAGSAIAVIVGGLFLLYRGLIDYRVPLIIVLVAFAGFAALPTLLMPGAHVDWASGITFASYQIMASPLLLMAFFIAGSRSICPAGAKATTVFAMVVGTLAVLAQLYVSAAYGAYVAIAFAAILGPWIGERFAPDATERDR
jgi:electron transport complex protein RnfD